MNSLIKLNGKKGIILGIANEKSIAWGIAEKLSQERFKVFGYDQNSELYDDSSFSFETVNDIDALLKKFTEKKVLWVMVPSGEPTNKTIIDLSKKLAPGDVIIDGGNSYYKDSIDNSVICKNPLANKVPDSKAAGILNLSKIMIRIIEDMMSNIK